MNQQIQIRTKEELNSFLHFINNLNNGMFRSDNKDNKDWNKSAWFKDVEKQLGSTEGLKTVDLKKIKEYENWARNVESIQIVTSFTPSQDFLYKVFKVFQDSNFNNFVIESVKDLGVKNGAKIYAKGKYIDLTLKKRINNFIRENDVVGKYL